MKPLNKEFSDKDKRRARNLLTGRENQRTSTGIGYSKAYEYHKEGDVWEEDGKNWTIKDNIKQNITKLDSIKQSFLTPIFCPYCSHQMKHKFDNAFYKIHQKCYDCVVKFETNLKRLGLFEEYEKGVVNSNIDGLIEDFKAYIYDRLQESESFITEKGVVEKWDGDLDKERVLESMKDTIKYLETYKK